LAWFVAETDLSVKWPGLRSQALTGRSPSRRGQTCLWVGRVEVVDAVSSTKPAARERILDTAYELFTRRGIRDVGVDELIERAKVAKATLYRYFPSKNDLVDAFLKRREEVWTLGWVEAGARRRGGTAEEQLLAIFDLFDEWFHRDDFEGCSFVNVMLELGPRDPAGRASVQHLETIRAFLRELAEEAGVVEPEAFALSWHILMKGSIVLAGAGDLDAAQRAREMGVALIERFRRSSEAGQVAL
jgi:AcrR family transcriptional regulator